MVGTCAFVDLVQYATACGTKVVAVGDPRQLPSSEAGGLFAALAMRLGAAELGRNLRQPQPWERDALEQLRGWKPPGLNPRHRKLARAARLRHRHIRCAMDDAPRRAQLVDRLATAVEAIEDRLARGRMTACST